MIGSVHPASTVVGRRLLVVAVLLLVAGMVTTGCGLMGAHDPQGWSGNEVLWDGERFVALGYGEYWESTDGPEWAYREGTPLVGAGRRRCPDGFACDLPAEVLAEIEASQPVSFHYSHSFRFPVAALADRILFSVQVRYSPFQDWIPDERLEGDRPVHPDLLALAAETEPCFARLLEEQTSGEDLGVELASWGTTGRSDGWRVTMRCRSDDNDDGVVFSERLGGRLTEAETVRLDELPRRLWVEFENGETGPVVDPPELEFRAEGDPDGRLRTTLTTINSSGRRLWSTDRGKLVVSDDGLTWTEVEPSPVGGEVLPDSTGGFIKTVASFGGHVAAAAVDDVRLPLEGETRWMVSHDDGVSWSPIEGPAFSWLPRLSVGPVGLLWPDDGVGYRLASAGTETVVIEVGQPTGQAAVGSDRIVVHDYELDGTEGRIRSFVHDGSGRQLYEIDR